MHFRVTRGPRDLLLADNAAWAAPRRGAVKMLVLAKDPGSLRRVLEINPAVSVRVVTETQLASLDTLEDFDLALVDGDLNVRLDAIPSLLFHPLATSRYSTGSQANDPQVTGIDPTHPVNRYLSFREVRFQKIVKLDRMNGPQVLVDSDQGPLLVAEAGSQARRLIAAFPLSSTDLARRVSFPILLTNAVRWLLENDSKLKGQFRAGQRLRFRGKGPIKISLEGNPDRTYPSGEKDLTVLSPFQKVGVHTVQVGKGLPLPYPVNLSSPQESKIEPVGTGEAVIQAGQRQESGGLGQREIWPFLVVLGLGFLMLEWGLLSLRGGAS